MSKRKRAQHKAAWKSEIEWLNHRTGYPTPEEREAIIEMRKELSVKMIGLFVGNRKENEPAIRAMISQYGPEEVELSVNQLRERMQIVRVAEDARQCREYRLGFALFGAGLQYYSSSEREKLHEERDELFIKQVAESGDIIQSKESEVGQSILIGWQDWADITPLAAPTRPADFTPPAPGSYSPPVSELLEYGPDLQKEYDFSDPKWRKAIPTLTRMALDPGLLNGWPGESSSWAPWHAVHMLALLEAGESAPALAQLADLEDDWLSDHLPHIWADMGAEAIPSLWVILGDKKATAKARGLAAEALFNLAEDDDAMTLLVAKGFGKILQRETDFDPRVNAHLISFLQDLEGAVEEIENEVVDAFEAGRVDEDYITFDEVFGDDEEEDEFFDEEDED